MSDLFDPKTAGALDRFTVPALPADFAERLVARASAISTLPSLPTSAPRRSARSGWRRGGIIVAGVAGLGLMSAAAAATGIFGDALRVSVRSAPVIRTIIASVAPEAPKVVAKPKPVKLAKPAPSPPTIEDVVAVAPPTEAAPTLPPRRELRREIIAERIVERIERRAARRVELGLPPRPIRPLAVAPQLRNLPQEDRAVIMDRVRELRAAAKYSNRPTRADGTPETHGGQRFEPDDVGDMLGGKPAGPAIDTPDQMSSPKADAPPKATRSPERAEQRRAFREQREMRQHRRELRRQRQQ